MLNDKIEWMQWEKIHKTIRQNQLHLIDNWDEMPAIPAKNLETIVANRVHKHLIWIIIAPVSTSKFHRLYRKARIKEARGTCGINSSSHHHKLVIIHLFNDHIAIIPEIVIVTVIIPEVRMTKVIIRRAVLTNQNGQI